MRSEAEIRELKHAMRVVVGSTLHGPNADMKQAMVAQTVIDSLDWVLGNKCEQIENFMRHITAAKKKRDAHERN